MFENNAPILQGSSTRKINGKQFYIIFVENSKLVELKNMKKLFFFLFSYLQNPALINKPLNNYIRIILSLFLITALVNKSNMLRERGRHINIHIIIIRTEFLMMPLWKVCQQSLIKNESWRENGKLADNGFFIIAAVKM